MNDICNALLTFLNDCATDNEQKVMISALPTRSEHKQMATEILNKILLKHPEWLPTVVSLAAYPIQVWARESRSGLSLNPAVLIQNIAEYHRDYFGFINPSVLSSQKIQLEHTDRIIDLITEILYGKKRLKDEKKMCSLRNIHGLKKTNVTFYTIRSCYEDAVVEVCQKYNNEFKEMTDSVSEAAEMISGDIRYVYHDADKLICLLPVMRKDKGKREFSIDYQAAAEMLDQCIHALQKYPLKGEAIYKVMRYHAMGYSPVWIAEKYEMSVNSVKLRIHDGDLALSYLIWGYASRDIIDLITVIR